MKIEEHEIQKKNHKAAVERLYLAIKRDNGFLGALQNFVWKWEERGRPGWLTICTEEKNVHFDETLRRTVYSGLYYDLRELCDASGLCWSYDAALLLAIVQSDGKTVPEPRRCPTAEHWKWFRQARKGLGLPNQAELDSARKVSNRLRTRDLSRGLPYAVIAETAHVSELTVQNAIKECWEYLEGGANIGAIGELAGLGELDSLILFFAPELRKLRERKAKE